MRGGAIRPTALAIALLGSAGVAGASPVPFNAAQVWEFDCVLDTDRDDAAELRLVWNRDAGLARTLSERGNDKGLGLVPGFARTAQHAVHFWMSPATAKFTGAETRDGRYGDWIEGFGPTFISVRSNGEMVITSHDMTGGQATAVSTPGRCTLTGSGLGQE